MRLDGLSILMDNLATVESCGSLRARKLILLPSNVSGTRQTGVMQFGGPCPT